MAQCYLIRYHLLCPFPHVQALGLSGQSLAPQDVTVTVLPSCDLACCRMNANSALPACPELNVVGKARIPQVDSGLVMSELACGSLTSRPLSTPGAVVTLCDEQ